MAVIANVFPMRNNKKRFTVTLMPIGKIEVCDHQDRKIYMVKCDNSQEAHKMADWSQAEWASNLDTIPRESHEIYTLPAVRNSEGSETKDRTLVPLDTRLLFQKRVR